VTIDDLLAQLDKVKNVKAVLFVDDTVLWTPLPKCQEYQFSQKRNIALTSLSDWYKDNKYKENFLPEFHTEITNPQSNQ
jgi:hypothetical protein